MSHLQVDYVVLVRYNIQLAIELLIVYFTLLRRK